MQILGTNSSVSMQVFSNGGGGGGGGGGGVTPNQYRQRMPTPVFLWGPDPRPLFGKKLP